MRKEDKLLTSQRYIDGMNVLTQRFAPYGVDENKKYIKKPEGEPYHTKAELKYMLQLHEEINSGMKLKLDEQEKEVTDFDGATNGKPLVTKARTKMKEKYPEEEDMDDIVGVYFDSKNKDKVGDKAKKVK